MDIFRIIIITIITLFLHCSSWLNVLPSWGSFSVDRYHDLSLGSLSIP